MARVKLSSPLRDLADRSGTLEVQAGTVGEIIATLERDHPKLSGWVTDEQGRIREHVKVFLNGEVATLNAEVSDADLIHVLPSISGGAVQTATRPQTTEVGVEREEAELLVGTRKGLFVLRGPRGGPMQVVSRS